MIKPQLSVEGSERVVVFPHDTAFSTTPALVREAYYKTLDIGTLKATGPFTRFTVRALPVAVTDAHFVRACAETPMGPGWGTAVEFSAMLLAYEAGCLKVETEGVLCAPELMPRDVRLSIGRIILGLSSAPADDVPSESVKKP